jgi:hypothetical protein
MASESETARLVYAQFGVEFDAETRRAYERLDKLYDDYQAARDRVTESGSDSDKTAYRKAKRKFAEARREQREREVEHPDHPRGARGFVVAAATGEEN